MTSQVVIFFRKVSALQKRFDIERENSRLFKDNVKKQFEERQTQVSAFKSHAHHDDVICSGVVLCYCAGATDDQQTERKVRGEPSRS